MRFRPPPAALAVVGLGALFAVGYPLVAARALEAWDPRSVAAGILALAVASLAVTTRSRVPGFGTGLRALPLALPALALATGDVRFLRLLPAAIEGVLCAVFLGSLRGGGSIMLDAARLIEPHAPDFIAPYCRKSTVGFAVLFAAQAAALVWVALSPPTSGWARASSLLVWGPTLVGTAFEFLLRKVWFRAFRDGPLDRVLRVVFPPENTPQGRRSLAYIRRKRKELGMPPP